MPTDLNSPLRVALRKCISRKPGEGVTLTDSELVALWDYIEAGISEEIVKAIEGGFEQFRSIWVSTRKPRS